MSEPTRPENPRRLHGWLGRRRVVIGALTVAAFATAVPVAGGFGEGTPLEGGVRNPSPDQSLELQRETEIIADVDTYGTRQSNKSNNGGGAIYGCRSGAGGTPQNNEPCVRANNLAQGRAFEFETDGTVAGAINAGDGGPDVKPLVTNATGIATGLNADNVDGQDFDAAAVAANGQVESETTPAINAARTGVGTYQVDFTAQANARCYFQATPRTGPAFVAVQGQPQVGRAVVTTFAANGQPLDVPFFITAQCAYPDAQVDSPAG